MSLLTGSPGRGSGNLRVVEPVSQPKPDPTAELVGVMKGTLDYLRMEPEARAKLAAEGLLAAERERHERELAAEQAARAEREAAVARAEEERERLRTLLNESDAGAEQLRAELAARASEVETIRAEAQRLAEERARAAAELEELRKRPTTTAPAAPSPAPRPERVEVMPKFNQAGYLAGVVLQAEGYEDVLIDIVRGADNKVRTMKVRNR